MTEKSRPDYDDPSVQFVLVCSFGPPRKGRTAPDSVMDAVTRHVKDLGLRPVGPPAYDVRRLTELPPLERGMVLNLYPRLARLRLLCHGRRVRVVRAWQRSAPTQASQTGSTGGRLAT